MFHYAKIFMCSVSCHSFHIFHDTVRHFDVPEVTGQVIYSKLQATFVRNADAIHDKCLSTKLNIANFT